MDDAGMKEMAFKDLFKVLLQNIDATDLDHPLAVALLNGHTSSTLMAFLAVHENHPLNTNTLARISFEYSFDTATLYFLYRTYIIEANKKLHNRYVELVSAIKIDKSPDLKSSIESLSAYFIAFVPGFGYKEDKTTGADFARQRRFINSLGIESELIEIEEWGTIEDNTEIIKKRLIELRTEREMVIVVSTSKGGLETAMALSQMNEVELGHIKHWISVGGILKGSPLADPYLSFPKSILAWFILKRKGQTKAFVKQLSYNIRKLIFDTIKISPSVSVLHFVGAPLSYRISERIKKRHKFLSKFGPNDGLTPIADQLLPNGRVITEIGLDHYFEDDDIDIKTLALALAAIET